jgi:hypothetical protein
VALASMIAAINAMQRPGERNIAGVVREAA